MVKTLCGDCVAEFLIILTCSSRSATITVELWNEGERAFKPRLYGNVIKIQRRITNTTTQYKIMSASGMLTISPFCFSLFSLFFPFLFVSFLQLLNKFRKSGAVAGEVKATKADDLRQILNHYGLQIDNPVNFLTQELAKQFLNSAKPTELYAVSIQLVRMEYPSWRMGRLILHRVHTAMRVTRPRESLCEQS
jgi:hypothetical protein